jgi:hypothetical protein
MAEGFVTRYSKLPAAADPRRSVPAHSGARVDAIEAALQVLGEEGERLQRLGLEGPRERCRQARRFWGFVGAIYHLADLKGAAAPRCGGGW